MITGPTQLLDFGGVLSAGSGGRGGCRAGLGLSSWLQGRGNNWVANHHPVVNFRDGSELDLFTHRPRAAAVTPQRQRAFPFRQCGGKRGPRSTRNKMPHAINFESPLVSLEVAALALGQNRKQMLAMIAARQLPWCFDLALQSRGEIRVLTQSLACVQGSAGRVSDFTAAMQIIFPDAPQVRLGAIAKIPLSVIARQLSIGSDHALRLARAGWLQLVKGTTCQRGPHGSPEVAMASVVEFLKRRRVS